MKMVLIQAKAHLLFFFFIYCNLLYTHVVELQVDSDTG